VCGSMSTASRRFSAACRMRGVPVLQMPPGLFIDTEASMLAETEARTLIESWAAEIAGAVDANPRVVVVIGGLRSSDPKMPALLTRYLCQAVVAVLRRCSVDHLFCGGGATARALVTRLGWRRLSVERQLAAGVVRMRAVGATAPTLTIKPGSYPWPDALWVGT
jgi:D-threonate/D-erythronate kinase